MRISASVFSSDNPVEYAELLKDTEIDYLHLDYFEKQGKALNQNELRKYNNYQKPLDVHLICSAIDEETINTLNNSPTEILSVQIENLKDIKKTAKELEKFKGDFGFAISPNTDWKVLLPYKNRMKHILVMSSIPGISGAKFIENSYQYIDQVKDIFSKTKIYVDGGINYDIYEKLSEDVSLVVLGSYLYNNIQNISETINKLKRKGGERYAIRQAI